MNVVVSPACWSLLTLLLQTSIILLVGLGLVRVLRHKGPVVASAIYKASVGGMLALVLSTFFVSPRSEPVYSVGVSRPVTVHVLPQPKLGAPVYFAPHSESLPDSITSVRQMDLQPLLLGTWAVVSFGLLIFVLMSHFGLRRLRKASTRLEEGRAYDMTQQVAALVGVRAPAVVLHPRVRSPFLAGIFRPTIYLAKENLSADDVTLRSILGHELFHLKQNDCSWRALERILCAIFWPQVLLWAVCRGLDAASEEICDNAVTRQLVPASAYANSLLTLAEKASQQRFGLAVGAGVVDFKSAVGKRISAILQNRSVALKLGGRTRVSIGIALLGVLAVVPIIVAAAGAKEAPSLISRYSASSDAGALRILDAMDRRYRSMSSFRCSAVVNSSGSRSILQLTYKRPSSARIVISEGTSLQPQRAIFTSDSRIVEDVLANKNTYTVVERPEKWNGSWSDSFSGFQSAPNLMHFSRFEVAFLLEPPADTPVQATARVEARLGNPTQIRGIPVDVVYSVRGKTRNVMMIGHNDHLLYRTAVEATEGSSAPSEEVLYKDFVVNGNVSDEEVEYTPPSNKKAVVRSLEHKGPSPEAQKVLDAVMAKYSSLSSLTFTDVFVSESDGMANNKVSRSRETATVEIAAAKPSFGSATLRMPHYSHQDQFEVLNGATLYVGRVSDTSKYMKVEAPYPGLSSFGGLGIPMGVRYGLEVTDLFYRPSPGFALRPFTLGKAKFAGKSMRTLVVEQSSDTTDGTPSRIRTTYFVGDDDLVHGVREEFSYVMKGNPMSSVTTDTFEHLQVNVQVPAKTFAFQPPPSAKVVDNPEDLDESIARWRQAPKIGDQVTPISGFSIDGKPFRLSDLAGKIIVLHSWSFGVTNYEQDVPNLERLSQRFRSKDVEVIGLVLMPESVRERAKDYLERHHITHLQVYDGSKNEDLARSLKLFSTPSVLVIDRSGKIVSTSTDIAEIQAAVESLIR